VRTAEIQEIAKTNQARFEWWVQKTFNVLPTDDRFLNLTEEQMDLIYEHFKLDHPELDKQQDEKARDSEYDNEQDSIPAQEHFEDPEFDKAWSGMDEEDDEWKEV
jgi:hypothetical protein